MRHPRPCGLSVTHIFCDWAIGKAGVLFEDGCFDPERVVPPARAEGPGVGTTRSPALKGPFASADMNGPYRAGVFGMPNPGLRPGLVEPAFQAGTTETFSQITNPSMTDSPCGTGFV